MWSAVGGPIGKKGLFFYYNIFLIKNQIGKICHDFLDFYLKTKILSREVINLRCSSLQLHMGVEFWTLTNFRERFCVEFPIGPYGVSISGKFGICGKSLEVAEKLHMGYTDRKFGPGRPTPAR